MHGITAYRFLCPRHRAPDDPRLQITKRLIALENDVVWDDGKQGTELIGKVRARGCLFEGSHQGTDATLEPQSNINLWSFTPTHATDKYICSLSCLPTPVRGSAGSKGTTPGGAVTHAASTARCILG